MILAQTLSFPEVHLVDVQLKPSKEDPHAEIDLVTAMTSEVAKELGRKTLLYDTDGLARGGFKSITLDLDDIVNVHLSVPDKLDLMPKALRGFRVRRQDGILMLQFTVKCDGYAQQIADFVQAVHGEPFPLEMASNQGVLPLVVAADSEVAVLTESKSDDYEEEDEPEHDEEERLTSTAQPALASEMTHANPPKRGRGRPRKLQPISKGAKKRASR